MFEREIRKYAALNTLASHGATVILGGDSDVSIPLSELRDAFDLGGPVYNRSVAGLNAMNAAAWFDAAVAPLAPQRVLLHIGENDLDLLERDAAAFDQAMRGLIGHIRGAVKDCDVAIIAHRSPTGDKRLAEMNGHLAVIAETEKCAFGDIARPRVWNPRETRTVMDFARAMGLRTPKQKPLYDLVKVLFCYEA